MELKSEDAIPSLSTKSLRPIMFSGRQGDWPNWKIRVVARLNATGYSDLLLDASVVSPSFAVAKIYTFLLESVPPMWQSRFALIPKVTLKPDVLKQGKKEHEAKYLPVPHPAVCFSKLTSFFERDDAITRNQLWSALDNLKQGDRDFQTFLHDLNFIADRLDSHGEAVPDGKKLRTLLSGVSDVAEHVIVMLEDADKMTFEKASSRLLSFFLRREAKMAFAPTASSASAFVSTSSAVAPVRGSRSIPTCAGCKKRGHSLDKCWDAHPELKPQRFVTVNQKLPPSAPSESQRKCNYCKKFGHSKDTCPKLLKRKGGQRAQSTPAGGPLSQLTGGVQSDEKTAEESFVVERRVPQALLSASRAVSSGETFIIDNGASSHFCNCKSLFTSLRRLSVPVEIVGVGAERVWEVGEMCVPLLVDGVCVWQRFCNTYYAPFLHRSLISLGTMSERGCSFTVVGPLLVGRTNARKVITAQRRNRLFVVDVCVALLPGGASSSRSLSTPTRIADVGSTQLSIAPHCSSSPLPCIARFDDDGSLSSRLVWGRQEDAVDTPASAAAVPARDSSLRGFQASFANSHGLPLAHVSVDQSSSFQVPSSESQQSLVTCAAPQLVMHKGERVLADNEDVCCSFVHSDDCERLFGFSASTSNQLNTQLRELLPSGRIRCNTSVDAWHQRLGHCSSGVLKELFRRGLPVDAPLNQVALSTCSACQFGKQHRSPFTGSTPPASRKFERIYCDIWGPARVTSAVCKFRYFIVFVDDYSDFKEVVFMQDRSQATQAVINFHKFWSSRFLLSLLFLRTDGEFISTVLKDYCRENGIAREFTPPHTPQHNAKAERANRSLLERARCFLFQSGVPSSYFPEAVSHACFVGNLVPRSDGIIPCLRWEVPMHKLGSFPIFGCEVFAMINTFDGKLAHRSIHAVFLGVDPERKAFKLLAVDGRKNFSSRDVAVNEGCFPFKRLSSSSSQSWRELSADIDALSFSADQDQSKTQQVQALPQGLLPYGSSPPGVQPSVRRDDVKLVSSEAPSSSPSGIDSPESLLSPPPPAEVSPSAGMAPSPLSRVVSPRRSKRPSHPPDRGPMVLHTAVVNDDESLLFPCCYFFDADTPTSPASLLTKEPSSLDEALHSPERDSWMSAAKQELDSMNKRGTWSLVDLPPGRRVVDNVWVFKRKLGPLGEILRYKARLCARGFSQTKGLDFEDTFSPVAAFRSLRIVLALAAQFDLQLYQLDVVAAFLNGKLDHEIYMRQPKGFEDGTQRVCRLSKAIYGLKQSSRLWNEDLHSTLLCLGLSRCLSEPCLYVSTKGDFIILLLVYVDDIIVATNNSKLYADVLRGLKEEYELTEQAEVIWILGWHIRRDPKSSAIFAHQTAFTNSLLKRHDMLQAKSAVTPGVYVSPSVRENLPAQPARCDVSPTKYRELIGSLLFLANCTRPDITFAVNMVCRHMSSPQPEHFVAAKRVLRYLVGAPSLGLLFRKSDISPSTPFLTAYSDSDWAGDTSDRKSTSGFVSFFGTSPISWYARKQSVVALSTMEAEYVAMSSATRECISLRNLLAELGAPSPEARICVDNEPALFLASNPVVTAKSKHIDIRHHFLRDEVAKKHVHFKWVPSDAQLADICTKHLQKELHLRLRASVVVPCPH